jgi:hypothetical protein
MSDSLALIEYPYCRNGDNYDPKFILALIVAVAAGAFFCRPRVTEVRFYDESKPEPESHLEPISSREQYLDDALKMAKQHRRILQDEVKMLENWLYYFQQNPGPSDFNRIFIDILETNPDGITSNDILWHMKYHFPQTTLADITTALESLKDEGLVSQLKGKKNLWRLQ